MKIANKIPKRQLNLINHYNHKNTQNYNYNSQIDENGTFTLTIDLFKKGGGERESQRLGVPLLGKIPLSQTIMDSTDAGNPIAFGSPDNPYSKIFSNIVLQIAKDLGH